MGAKSQKLFAAAILVSAAMHCWSAEAAPKNPGYKQTVRNASPDITTQIGTQDSNTVICYVYNKRDQNICAVYDVYPVWNFSQSLRGTVSQFIPGKNGRSIAWAFPSKQASSRSSLIQCKLVFGKVHALERGILRGSTFFDTARPATQWLDLSARKRCRAYKRDPQVVTLEGSSMANGHRVPAAASLLGLHHAVPFRQRSAAAALLAR